MSALRILVPVKRVIDYAASSSSIALISHSKRKQQSNTPCFTGQTPRQQSPNGRRNGGVKHSMNPFDELSIEESVRIREKKSYPHGVSDIIAFTCGPPKSADILRTAMAMGADRSIHVETKDGDEIEPLSVAKLLRAVVDKEKVDLVVLGKQSIDDDAGQTGQMLAGLLGWAQATQASKVSFEGDGKGVVVEKEVDGGSETTRSNLPMVVTADLRLNEPRYASLPNIMKAKKKKIEKITAEELGVDLGKRLKTLKVIEPPPRQGGGKVEDVDGMISKLKELGAI
ncbi:Electron transfer flavoprotein subunit beta [Lachnellula arida]|uniref:Probable electron transfer flavoprotein subunit beta n=1 Tax=Lachnellula arida TaxID=1316785 RepID=A0A8T9BAJ4_9HELO|nr:Electron transfer flavoprotein subunit beta [Lachnellula arida]